MTPLVYLAGPEAEGDPALNAHGQLRLAHELFETGLAQGYAPTHAYWLQAAQPRAPGYWAAWHEAMLGQCAAVLRHDVDCRLPGLPYFQPAGEEAALACARARNLGLPVFSHLSALLAWAELPAGAQRDAYAARFARTA
ncbi:MAG: hypothetical protein Q7P63_04560 [Verrucomicrobiota bacterium JB022]|nr:hypothetical protein [Verrucomicrobiota bacterium JB022]